MGENSLPLGDSSWHEIGVQIQVERPWDLARDSGQRSWHIPIRITAHPRGAFISVGDWTPTETNLLLLTTWRSGSLLDWDKIKSRQIAVYERSTYNITTKRFLFYCKIRMLYIHLWGIARACLKNAFCKMCITICGRFYLNEGGVAGYVNQMKSKYTINWGVQIAGMIFQTRSNFIQNSQQWYVYIHFSSISLIL